MTALALLLLAAPTPLAQQDLFPGRHHMAAPKGTSGGAWDLVLGDLDADGHLDVVLLDEASVAVFPGDGSGTLAAAQSTPTQTGGGNQTPWPQGLALADVDGDGWLDVVTTNSQSQIEASLLRNLGAGVLAPPRRLLVGSGPSRVRSADLDGDGDVDLVFGVRGPAGVVVLKGEGTGAFGPPAFFPLESGAHKTIALALGDVTGDGRPDALALDDEGSLFLLRNSGDGTLLSPTPLVPDAPVQSVALDDGNGDGLLDLIVGREAEIRLLTGDGVGGFRASLTIDVRAKTKVTNLVPARLGSAKVPGVIAQLHSPYGGGENIQLVPWDAVPSDPLAIHSFWTGGIASGDLDEDGSADMLLLLGNGVAVFRGDPRPTRLHGVVVSQAAHPSAAVKLLEDVSGDGILDAIVTSASLSTQTYEDARLQVHLGDGSGAFSLAQDEFLSDEPPIGTPPVAAGDWDGDGTLDLAVVPTSKAVAFLGGLGAGAFLPPQRLELPGGVKYHQPRLARVDFDADGADELAVVDAAAGKVAVFKWSVGGGPVVLHAANIQKESMPVAGRDVDGDGREELVFLRSDPAGQGLWALGSSPSGSFPPPTKLFDLPAEPGEPLALGDASGDGLLDALVFSTSSSFPPDDRLTLWEGSPAGAFVEFDTVRTWKAARPLPFLDLDGDGGRDLSARITYPYFGVGVWRRGPGQLEHLGDFVVPSLPSLADVDGDGRPDLVFALRGRIYAHLNLGS